jgi:hypothetical protein
MSHYQRAPTLLNAGILGFERALRDPFSSRYHYMSLVWDQEARSSNLRTPTYLRIQSLFGIDSLSERHPSQLISYDHEQSGVNRSWNIAFSPPPR